jgi:agmatine deiminase
MAWAVQPQDWDFNKKVIKKVKRELSEVMETIARRCACLRAATACTKRGMNFLPAPTSTSSKRRSMISGCATPTFAFRGESNKQEVVAIDCNFNGWGGTDADRPRRPGDWLAKTAESVFGVPRVSAGFVAEGGALITDGQGTIITHAKLCAEPEPQPGRRGPRGIDQSGAE